MKLIHRLKEHTDKMRTHSLEQSKCYNDHELELGAWFSVLLKTLREYKIFLNPFTNHWKVLISVI